MTGTPAAAAIKLLRKRSEIARKRAEASGMPVLASATVVLPAENLDPVIGVLATHEREADSGYAFCAAQPERGGWMVGAIGSVAVVDPTDRPEAGEGRLDGVDRFADAGAACAAVMTNAVIGEPPVDATAPSASGPTWFGGFAFDEPGIGGRRDSWWDEVPNWRLVLPEISITVGGLGRETEARLTVNAVITDDSGEVELSGMEARITSVLAAAYGGPPDQSIRSDAARVPTSQTYDRDDSDVYVGSVSRAKLLIEQGSFEKIVLARTHDLDISPELAGAEIFSRLRSRFGNCLSFMVAMDDLTFIGATPELLVRREGRQLATMALAGTVGAAGGRSAAAELISNKKDLDEHQIVVRRLEQTLGKISVWVATAENPEILTLANALHIATPIRAQLLEPLPLVELAGLLHPTPAVGGEPWLAARDYLHDLEPFDRGWYAGPLGWMDAYEEGEMWVALRCAVIRNRKARLYAGAGIVGQSDPASELAETEVKLEALRPLLTS